MNNSELRLLTEFHRQAVENAYVRRLDDDPNCRRWASARRVTWMLLLAGAFLFYYLLDRMQQALSIL